MYRIVYGILRLNGYDKFGTFSLYCHSSCSDIPAFKFQLPSDRPADLRFRKADFHLHFPLIRKRSQPDILHAARTRDLHPDTLPDSAGGRIPAPVRLDIPVLFSPGLGCIVTVAAHNRNSGSFLHTAYKRRHFHRKWCMAAAVASRPPSIDPDCRLIIHSSEIQPESGILRLLFPRKFPFIPQARMAFRLSNSAF